MKITYTLLCLSLTAWHGVTVAARPASPLIVVADHGGQSTLPYYEALVPPREEPDTQPARALPRSLNEAAMLPVRTPGLTPGIVATRRIQVPGLTPFFLLGDDPHSRAWLSQQLKKLEQLNAVGLVVNVEEMSALQALRILAPGLELVPVSAEDLALRLDLHHYPVLITATGIEQ